METVSTAHCVVAPKGSPTPAGMEALRECRQVPGATELQVLPQSLNCVDVRPSFCFTSFQPCVDIIGKPKDQSTVRTSTSQSRIREEVSLLVPFGSQVAVELVVSAVCTWKANA